MAESSQLSRSRIAVLAVTGIAAACGIYVLYDNFSDRQMKSPLHRSNAIHRPRRPSQQRRTNGVTSSYFLLPDETAPLGRLVLRYYHDSLKSYNVAEVGVPVIDDIDLNPDVEHDLHIAAVECVLTAVRYASTEEQRQYLADHDLHLLAEALSNRDVGAVRGLASNIRNALFSRVTLEEVQEGITKLSIIIASGGFTRDDSSEHDTHEVTFAETDDADGLQSAAEPSQGLKGLLYHIAEADAKRKAYEHRGIHCEECGERPIRGVRWHCLNCPDFDLCSTCEASTEHPKTHVFVKIKVPLPVLSQPTNEYPLWYPGDPRKYHSTLNVQLKKDLATTYGLDEPQMDAHYDQFTCIANVPWNDDPREIMAAIDRRAFNRALTSERWPERFRPNALYDRMFAFYDTNNDGLIGFEEFLSGLTYLRGSNRFELLDRALQGFDIDGDGFVGRADFLRLFRAKYEIQKLLINTMIECRENEQTQAAMDTLRSSLPISSVFVGEEIPHGEERPRGGKEMNSFGDMLPVNGAKAILGDGEGWPQRRSRESQHSENPDDISQPHGRVQHHSSRFEEILNDPTGGSDVADRRRDDSQQNLPHQHQEPSNLNSKVELESEALDVDEDSEMFEAVNEAILRQIVEDGFHEMLDPVFKAKEDQDRAAIESRSERSKWREEIDSVEEPKPAGELGRIIETFDALFDQTKAARDLVSGLMPTDEASLAQREAEIAQRPLEELLDATGYSVIEVGGTVTNVVAMGEGESNQESETVAREPLSRETDRLTNPREVSLGYGFGMMPEQATQDPTMPQNRPDSSLPTVIVSLEDDDNSFASTSTTTRPSQRNEATPTEGPPSRERLIYLASLDEQDRELKLRGGPGRLSYKEIEEIVKGDTRRELRGLVTSWLDWASF